MTVPKARPELHFLLKTRGSAVRFCCNLLTNSIDSSLPQDGPCALGLEGKLGCQCFCGIEGPFWLHRVH